MTFEGFPVAALDFYDDLEVDNTKAFWEEHRHVYDTAVKQPMTALMAELADEFVPDGESAKIFRPFRDVRFSNDKTPYKTHQGAFVPVAPATGYYVQVGAPGVRTGVGFYHATPARLASFREAVDHETFGTGLQHIVARLEGRGWTVGGDAVKTAPRGWSADHPRIDLLRHRTLTLGRDHGFEPYVHTAELLEHVREDWRTGRTFLDWILTHVRG